MRLVTSNLNTEIKYKKVSVNSLVPQPEIVMKTADGKTVENIRVLNNGEALSGFSWKYYADGKEVSSKEIHYFESKEDGSQHEVRPFDRTTEIIVVKEVPMVSVNGSFLIESTYELFHKEDSVISALYNEAERYVKEDIAGLALFSWGRGFKQYYALVYPVLRDGKFVWVMKLTQTRVVYQNLMTVPAEKEPVAKPPTLTTLPSLEALIVA